MKLCDFNVSNVYNKESGKINAMLNTYPNIKESLKI